MTFTNSYKMKLAVVLGVVHMTVGIILRGVNSFRKKDYIDIFTIVIPLVTFIYMDFLIILKWSTDFSDDTSKAPSIINTMISMIVGNKDSHPLQLYHNEKAVEKLCLVVAIIIIPILLLAKPILLKLKTRKFNGHSPRGSEGEVLNEDNNVASDQLANDLKKLGDF
jgi:V-type H+-transporting ATPase subunit a